MEYLFLLLCNIYCLTASTVLQHREKKSWLNLTISLLLWNMISCFLFPQKLIGIYLGSCVSASGLSFSIRELSVHFTENVHPHFLSNDLCLSPVRHEGMFHCPITGDQNSSHLSTLCGGKSCGFHFQGTTTRQSRSVASLCCGTGNSTMPEVRQLCRILLNAPWHFGSKSSKS